MGESAGSMATGGMGLMSKPACVGGVVGAVDGRRDQGERWGGGVPQFFFKSKI